MSRPVGTNGGFRQLECAPLTTFIVATMKLMFCRRRMNEMWKANVLMTR